jgi:hypothetical protein
MELIHKTKFENVAELESRIARREAAERESELRRKNPTIEDLKDYGRYKDWDRQHHNWATIYDYKINMTKKEKWNQTRDPKYAPPPRPPASETEKRLQKDCAAVLWPLPDGNYAMLFRRIGDYFEGQTHTWEEVKRWEGQHERAAMAEGVQYASPWGFKVPNHPPKPRIDPTTKTPATSTADDDSPL